MQHLFKYFRINFNTFCCKTLKQGPQGPQKLSSLNQFKTPHRYRVFSILQPEMASLSNSRWQTRRERPHLSTTDYGDIIDKAKHDAVSELVTSG